MDNDFYGDYESHDPYDSMPFGDAVRFEENCLAAEGHDDFFDEANDFEEEYDEEYA